MPAVSPLIHRRVHDSSATQIVSMEALVKRGEGA